MSPVLSCEWSFETHLPDAAEFGRDDCLNIQMDAQAVFPAELAFVVMNNNAGDTPQESGPNNG